jgi:hypothetical protein
VGGVRCVGAAGRGWRAVRRAVVAHDAVVPMAEHPLARLAVATMTALPVEASDRRLPARP